MGGWLTEGREIVMMGGVRENSIFDSKLRTYPGFAGDFFIFPHKTSLILSSTYSTNPVMVVRRKQPWKASTKTSSSRFSTITGIRLNSSGHALTVPNTMRLFRKS